MELDDECRVMDAKTPPINNFFKNRKKILIKTLV